MRPISRRSTAIRWMSRMTWDQYYDIAEFFNGMEVETAGEMAPIYGLAEAQKRNTQAYWVYLSHAAGYAKTPGNACFFFDCSDMTPEVNNPGFVRALEEYVASRALGPEEMINWDVADTRVQFPAGVSVFNIDWGDVGPISYNPDASVIVGDTGFGVLPGGSEYWDSTQDAWVTPESGVNRAPFIAFGGWIISVAAAERCQGMRIGLRRLHGSPGTGPGTGHAAGHRRQPVALQPAQRGRCVGLGVCRL